MTTEIYFNTKNLIGIVFFKTKFWKKLLTLKYILIQEEIHESICIIYNLFIHEVAIRRDIVKRHTSHYMNEKKCIHAALFSYKKSHHLQKCMYVLIDKNNHACIKKYKLGRFPPKIYSWN